MSLSAQDIDALTGIIDRCAEAAVSRAVLPLHKELGEIKGRLDQGKATMGSHREELDLHEERLDVHDGELAKLRPRAKPEPSPASGSQALTEKRRRRFLELFTIEAIQKYGPTLAVLTIGALLPYFGKALIALGLWIQHLSTTTP